jgi:hypothetical protein
MASDGRYPKERAMPLWSQPWYWKHRLYVRAERLAFTLARYCSHRVRYLLVIDAWAKTTVGPYGGTHPTTLSVDEMVRRLEALHNGTAPSLSASVAQMR